MLLLDTDTSKSDYVNQFKDINYNQQTLITCMEILKKENEENDSICQLVVGTESKNVYILPTDVNNSSFLCRIKLPSVPALFSITGTFDVEWRISVACRDGKLYTIRQGMIYSHI